MKNQNDVLINYTDSYNFAKKSFLDIYNNNFDKDQFKDKIVLI
jgi:CHASE2 domain-containing sensor protein